MKILLDEEIAGGAAAFADYGAVDTFAGRDLTREQLAGADVLLVRSVTRVDEQLLDGIPLRFVGTSTAGTDHVDLDYLAARGIPFASAPGCNAEAVAEHVICCIAAYSASLARPLRSLDVGVVGYGHVGRAVGRMLDALGIPFMLNDPPLSEVDNKFESAPLERVMRCQVVTVHVPLTTQGVHATQNLIGASELAQLPSRALLINAARGGVVDESRLIEHCEGEKALFAAIDCWEREPLVRADSLRAAWFASPHIAGHTREARFKATEMLQHALSAQLELEGPGDPPGPGPGIVLDQATSGTTNDILAQIHPLGRHTAAMREWNLTDAVDLRRSFDRYRGEFGLRRGFSAIQVAQSALDPDTVEELRALGVAVV